MFAVLLVIAAHDALLVWGGFALANKFYGVSLDASHLALHQSLHVYGDPISNNPLRSSQRSAILFVLTYDGEAMRCMLFNAVNSPY